MNRKSLDSRTAAALCLLAAATLAVHLRTAFFPFVNFDDELLVAGNDAIRGGLSLQGIIWAFTTDMDAGWIPLTWLSRMADVSLFGMNAGGHHLVNVLLHLSNVLLLFIALRRMTGRAWESGIAAALFAVHPVHVESVAWVAERKDVLAGFFWMLSLLAYARYAERPGLRRYLAVALCFLLGLLSKPIVVTLPFVLLLLDAWPLGRFRRLPGDVRACAPAARLILEKVPLFALSAAASAVTVVSEMKAGAMARLGIESPWEGIVAAPQAYLSYLGKLAFPKGLAVFYPPPAGPVSLSATAGAFLLLCIPAALSVRHARRCPWLGTGWFWFLGVLVPMIGLLPVGDFKVADRCLYLPAIGIYLVVAFGGAEAAARLKVPAKAAASAAVALVLLLGGVAAAQVSYWRDSEALFRRALSVTEANWLAHGNLAHWLAKQGRVAEAVSHYREALRIRPTYTDAHVNLGVALQGEGKLGEAEAHFREAIRLVPELATARNNLGSVLQQRGSLPEAIALFREAIRLKPGYAGAWNNLGIALLDAGQPGEAETAFREAVRLDPSLADAWNNLGVSLARQGRVGEAKAHFEAAVRLAPGHRGAVGNLGRYRETSGEPSPGGRR
jgi:Tfp pilus assembly protein PilF